MIIQMMNCLRGTGILLSVLACGLMAQDQAGLPRVTQPPESFFQLVREPYRPLARQFYKKYIDIDGLPVVASDQVDDLALQRTYQIVKGMLAGRPDILQAMVKDGMYLIIIGKDQVYTDMPEYSRSPNPAYVNERVRGTGGRPTSFGEENLLSLPVDRYDDESIAVHEFCHTIDSTLMRIDPQWRSKRDQTYNRSVREKGLFAGTYAGSNAAEYWAEIAQAYFNCNRINNWNHGPIGRRDQLKVYDPDGYQLVHTTFRLSPDKDWQYTWLQPLPNVTRPPAKFKIDPFYTKFTWAREFIVLGRGASDQAMLKANDTIRKMFAYRHDILKALILDGIRMVVLGPQERITDLPEFHGRPGAVDSAARSCGYSTDTKLLVVDQPNVMADPSKDPFYPGCQVIRLMAEALYYVAGTRPVDPNWDTRPARVWQQYELGLTRLDERFDAALSKCYQDAISSGKWKGTPACHDKVRYWAEGVLAYFDATGPGTTPVGAAKPINSRELLEVYDPNLFRLVEQTMAYRGKVDWRYR